MYREGQVCQNCNFVVGLYPRSGKCPACGASLGVPSQEELYQIHASIPRMHDGDYVDWKAITSSMRDIVFLASLVVSLAGQIKEVGSCEPE